MNVHDDIIRIENWAHDRNIINGSKPKDQLAKLMEEVGELAGALARNKLDSAVDGIGDSVVVLIIIAAQLGYSLEECINRAYNEIKDRKGRMIDGVFVKEADLNEGDA